MDYLNRLIGKWMPADSPRMAVDSHPRLSGLMDTVNATRAHGKATRLPKEFYDAKLLKIVDDVAVDEWFTGYQVNQEYRTLGIGSLVGDIVSRMVGSVEQNGDDGLLEIGGESGSSSVGRGGEKGIRFALSGCHDTTLAGFLSGFGAFKNEAWPHFSSHIAVELFRQHERAPDTLSQASIAPRQPSNTAKQQSQPTGWLSSFFGFSANAASSASSAPASMVRMPSSAMSSEERKSLEGYFVRVRYNDRPVTIPGCRAQGSHLAGDESFCTLVCDPGT